MVVLVTVIVFVVAYAGMALWMRKIERFTESEERALALGDRLLKGEEGMNVIHKPWSVYTECEHQHDPEDDDGAIDVPEVGRTCKVAFEACSECCAEWDSDGYYLNEVCEMTHKHGPDLPFCPNKVAQEAAFLEESDAALNEYTRAA